MNMKLPIIHCIHTGTTAAVCMDCFNKKLNFVPSSMNSNFIVNEIVMTTKDCLIKMGNLLSKEFSTRTTDKFISETVDIYNKLIYLEHETTKKNMAGEV